METINVLDLNKLLETHLTDENKEDLTEIFQEFKREHYPNVLSKTKLAANQYPDDENLNEFLDILNVISHTEIGELKASKEIIERLFRNADKNKEINLVQLAELAFMSDYRLSRRIMTEAIKRLENDAKPDSLTLARAYLVLGEAEENLQKFKRAIKYFQKGLKYYQTTNQASEDNHLPIYLNFKIGMLNSTLHETEEAISYFKRTNELAVNQHADIKAFSLIGLAKTYATNDMADRAYPHLIEALEIIEGSSLTDSLTHAEAITELALYYFTKSKLKEAIPYYEQAINTYMKQPRYSARMLGMIYMQYAYCLNHEEEANKVQAGQTYEHAIELLEKANDPELLENALADVIAFFDQTKNDKKKRVFEEKLVKIMAD